MRGRPLTPVRLLSVILFFLSWGAMFTVTAQTGETDQAAREIAERNERRRMQDLLIPDTEGSGAYPALMEVVPDFPGFVIYRPKDLTVFGSDRNLGILVWGNGGCTDDGASARLHLAEIASHGFLVVAPGNILNGPSASKDAPAAVYMATTKADMERALAWALNENVREGGPFQGRIDTEAVAVAGHSCGGMLAIMVAADPRVRALIVHNSGLFPNHPQRPTLLTDPTMLKALHTPVLYVVGNETDVGFPVAMDDYSRIEHVPVMVASLGTAGHEGTFRQENGGVAATVAVHWLEWQLRGSEEAAKTFIGEDCLLCTDANWTVKRKGF